MSATGVLLFTCLILLGLIFFFMACLLAARPASGTTEWINYKCRRKLEFCPPPKSLSLFDLIPITLLTAAALGVMYLTAAYLPPANFSTPLSHFRELPVFYSLYFTHLLWAIAVPFTYVFIKNLTGGFFIPVSGAILIMLDKPSLVISQSSGAVSASVFMLTAIYFTYRYSALSSDCSQSKKIWLLLGACLSAGIGSAFNTSALAAVFCIIAVFIIKETASCRQFKAVDSNLSKKRALIYIAIFIPCCIILSIFTGVVLTLLCTNGGSADLSTSFVNAGKCFFKHLFSSSDVCSNSVWSVFMPVLRASGIFAVPCCIYQAVNAKDGNSLFALIIFATYLIGIFAFGFCELLPVFAVPVIAQCFAALRNRKQKFWVYMFLAAAILYIGFVKALNVV